MMLRLFDDAREAAPTKAVVTLAGLAAVNVLVWGWAWVAFSATPALLGTALIAYLFGLRHAFDADHIAAIDNVVRKLMQEGKAPLSVGFFFSLGHSTIVVLATVAIAATAAAVQGRLEDVHGIGGVIGTAVSAFFLLLLGVVNLFILKNVWAVFQRVRGGARLSDEDLDAVLSGGGFLARLFRSTFRIVTRSWHMYPIGFLFGLGFDTATEIGVLGISAAQATNGASLWNILVFPALFTAGMSLMDTVDSVLMTGAYGWAFVNPVRKLWYNLTITTASVVIALFIGSVEALGLVVDKLGLEGQFWSAVSDLNENLAMFGFWVVGLFAASWLVSALIYRFNGYDRLAQST